MIQKTAKFDSFHLRDAEARNPELINYAKNALNTVPVFLDEQNLVQWLPCEDEPAITQMMNDKEIIASV